ncbi:MAG: EF-hand domain-containing protein [Candidatus Thiodiazotropha sp.]
MNGISGIGGMNQMQAFPGTRRPYPEEMAQQLFSRLDASDQGYIEKSDLLSALETVSSVTDASDLSRDDTALDELFTQLDSDGDGKVTEEEFTDSMVRIDQQINDLFSQMRMNEAKTGMAPPPPPPPPEGMNDTEDLGFTKEELQAQLKEIGSSDEKRSTLIENIIANFEEADSDGDGRVNLNEAMAFEQSGDGTTESSGTPSASNSDMALSEKVMLQIVRLMQSYNLGSDAETEAASSLSVSV